MKKIYLLATLFQLHAHAYQIDELLQYPENRSYTARDRGMMPYLAPSLYKTGTFTLTFDDGPDLNLTPIVLDTLKKYNIKATFFILTSKVDDTNVHLIKRMLDEGHIVASHGYNHDRSRDLSRATWKSRVKRSFIDLAKWYKDAGHEFTKFYYRFPYGDYGQQAGYHHINVLKEISQELMGDNCIQMAFWDIDSSDWVPGMTPQNVANNIKAYNEGGLYYDFKKKGNTFVKVPVQITEPTSGGVVLQHDVHESTAYGLEIFLKYAQEKNLKLVRLDEVEEFKVTKNCRL